MRLCEAFFAEIERKFSFSCALRPILSAHHGAEGIAGSGRFPQERYRAESHCCAPGPINALSGIKGPTGTYW